MRLGNTSDGAQEDIGQTGGQVEVKEEIEEVVEIVTAQLVERNGLVEKLVEQELIKNVERKCEMVAKDRSQLVEEGIILLKPKWSTEQDKDYVNEQYDDVRDGSRTAACEEEKAEDECNILTEHVSLIDKMVKEAVGQSLDLGKRVQVKEKMEDPKSELQSKDGQDICDTLEGATERQTLSDLSPQAWVEALEQLQPYESGSNEKNEKQRGREIPEEALGSLLKEVNKEGSEEEEEEEEDEKVTQSRNQERLEEVEHAEKNICSLSGWHSNSSSVNVEPPTPGRSVSSDLLDKQERYKCNPTEWHLKYDLKGENKYPLTFLNENFVCFYFLPNSQENSSESITSSSRAESGRSRPNGDNSKHSPQDASSDSSNGRKDGTPVLEKKVQVMLQ